MLWRDTMKRLRLTNKPISRLALIFSALLLLTAIAFTLRAPAKLFFFNRGLEAKREWRLEDAISNFARGLSLDNNFPAAQLEKALCLQMQGNFIAARKELDELQTRQIEDRALRARFLNALGVNHFNSSDADAAIEQHTRSLELAREIADGRLEAQALMDLGRATYHLKGEPQQALELLTKALEIGRAFQDELLEADALRNIGALKWWFKGELESPLTKYYEPALQIYWRHNELRGAAITLCNISLIHYYKGDFFEFLKLQNESLELKRRVGDRAGLCDSYAFLGQMYNELGNPRKAYECYAKSIELSRAGGYKLVPAEESMLAAIRMQTGDYDQTIKLLNSVLAKEDSRSLVYKYTIGRIGHVYLLNGNIEAAKEKLERALELELASGTTDQRYISAAWSLLGECYLKLGDRQKAAALLAQSDRLSLTGLEGGRSIYNLVLLAELMKRQGQREEAVKYLSEAADLDGRIFRTSETSPLAGQTQRTYDTIFKLLFELRAESGKTAQASDKSREEELLFRFLEQLRYRALKNIVAQMKSRNTGLQPQSRQEQEALLKIRRLADRLKREGHTTARQELLAAYSDYEDLLLKSELSNPQYRLIREARPLRLQEARRSLDEKTALVHYLFVGDQACALLITGKTVKSIALPITKSSLLPKVKLFRSLIFNGAKFMSQADGLRQAVSDAQDWKPLAVDLHKALVAPLEETGGLAGIERLGIIPFGSLHDLPFAALARFDDDKVRFLIEDYTLFRTPTASFLAEALNRPNPPNLPQSLTMLSFGRNLADEPELLPLGYAVEEAREVAQIFSGEARVAEEATESELAQLAPHFKYLHFATHAVSEAQMPLLSRLKLQSTQDSDGNLTVREIFELGLQAELVTLGACQSGQSFSASGNELGEGDRIGLIDAFLRAGAKSVFASLLPISDRPTAEFMKAFYQNLGSMDKAEALAQTQRAMLRGELSLIENHTEHKLSHPRYWSPFILVGNYR